MSKKKTILLLVVVLLLLIVVYILLSFRKDDNIIEQAVPYSYFHWFTEPEQQIDSDIQTSANNVIVFRQDP